MNGAAHITPLILLFVQPEAPPVLSGLVRRESMVVAPYLTGSTDAEPDSNAKMNLPCYVRRDRSVRFGGPAHLDGYALV